MSNVDGIKDSLKSTLRVVRRSADKIEIPNFPDDLPDAPGFREIKQVYRDSLDLGSKVPANSPARPLLTAIPKLIPGALLTGFGLNMLLYGSLPMKALGGAMAAAGIPFIKSFADGLGESFRQIGDALNGALRR